MSHSLCRVVKAVGVKPATSIKANVLEVEEVEGVAAATMVNIIVVGAEAEEIADNITIAIMPTRKALPEMKKSMMSIQRK